MMPLSEFSIKETMYSISGLIGISSLTCCRASDQFVRESAPAQAYDIDSAISNRFASRYNIRWDVFAKPASALYHYVSAYPAELVHQDVGTYDSIVIDNDFACHFRRICFLRVYHGLRVRLP